MPKGRRSGKNPSPDIDHTSEKSLPIFGMSIALSIYDSELHRQIVVTGGTTPNYLVASLLFP